MAALLLTSRNRIRLSRLLALLLLITLSLSLTAWHDTLPLVEHGLWLVGWLCVGVGMMGRVWCATYIAGFKNVRLATEGPYSISRNPLYFFSFVAGLGVMLLTETLLLPLLFTVFFLGYYRWVIRAEEKTLLGLHGAAFSAYLARVPRFWPDLSLFTEPVSYAVSPKDIRRFLAEVVWFVWAAALIQLLEELHIQSYLPTLLKIY